MNGTCDLSVFVATCDEDVVGFGEFEADGHIGAVYVHHEYQGQGVASLLLERIEQEAERRKVARLFTEASITALSFFQKRGFVVMKV